MMSGVWDDEERAREWPVESLSAWASAVVEHVERSGGDGDSAYGWMYELADTLTMWEPSSLRAPGQVWTEEGLRETRRRFAHLIQVMRSTASDLVPERPAWITLQLVDLLDTGDGLPILSPREIERRERYLKLHGSIERMETTQFDLQIAACGDDEPDSRRPETPDEGIRELMDRENVRPRTLEELADDLREEAARSYLPADAAERLTAAASLARRGEADAAVADLERVVERLYEEMSTLGDFRAPLR